jgi:hypothetical protein
MVSVNAKWIIIERDKVSEWLLPADTVVSSAITNSIASDNSYLLLALTLTLVQKHHVLLLICGQSSQ